MNAHDPSSPQRERRRLLALMSSTLALAACGGGGGGEEPPRSPPPPVGPSPAVDGPPWRQFGGDPQHGARSAIATQALGRIAWQTPVDLAPNYSGTGSLLAHYASPLCSAKNTVIVAVKTGSGGGFRIEARAGGNGGLIWQADSDYLLPPGFNWVPTWNSALDAQDRLYIPAAGGRLLVRDANAASATIGRAVFYGAAAYDAAPATYNASVHINTPITIDAAGNVFFGFVVNTATLTPNPLNLVSGIARIDGATGFGSWVGAAAAAADITIGKPASNCAPALSPDGRTLYIAVNTPRGIGTQVGYLLALDSTTLATKARVALNEPLTGGRARISDDATTSPTVGPDGDVYYGVLDPSGAAHNGRGWLLHFDATLATARIPGSFGWDNTPSIVPASLVTSYGGSSAYLLMVKYNNYLGFGTGDGQNEVAIIDPFAGQADRYRPAVTVMAEVLRKLGPTPATGGGITEWCINTCAVDPATKSVLANSEDGYLYRWDLTTNTFTERIRLTQGIFEAYTPTAVAADGSVLAIQNAILFCVGRN